MGKGDKKTKRGKITLGTYGVTRPRKKKKKTNKPIEIVEKEKPAKKKTASPKVQNSNVEKPKTPKKAAAKKKASEE